MAVKTCRVYSLSQYHDNDGLFVQDSEIIQYLQNGKQILIK